MLIWKCATKQLKIDNFSIQNILEIFFSNKEESTYYFMFLILGVYITIPVLSKLSDKCNRKLCWYTVITIFITQSTLPVIFKLFNITYNNSLSIQIGGYMIFILLGYLLSTEDLTKKQIIIIYIMGALSIIFRYSMTYYLTNVTGKLDKTLFDYTQFHSVLLACAVFIFIKNIDFDKIIKSNKIRNVLAKTASCSFGIYLIHLIVKYYEILIFNIDIKSWQWRTLGIVTTYLLSLGIVYMLKHIPIINKIVP